MCAFVSISWVWEWVEKTGLESFYTHNRHTFISPRARTTWTHIAYFLLLLLFNFFFFYFSRLLLHNFKSTMFNTNNKSVCTFYIVQIVWFLFLYSPMLSMIFFFSLFVLQYGWLACMSVCFSSFLFVFIFCCLCLESLTSFMMMIVALLPVLHTLANHEGTIVMMWVFSSLSLLFYCSFFFLIFVSASCILRLILIADCIRIYNSERMTRLTFWVSNYLFVSLSCVVYDMKLYSLKYKITIKPFKIEYLFYFFNCSQRKKKTKWTQTLWRLHKMIGSNSRNTCKHPLRKKKIFCQWEKSVCAHFQKRRPNHQTNNMWINICSFNE